MFSLFTIIIAKTIDVSDVYGTIFGINLYCQKITPQSYNMHNTDVIIHSANHT